MDAMFDSLSARRPTPTAAPCFRLRIKGIKTILVEDNRTIQGVSIPTLIELGDMEIMAVAETACEAIAAMEKLDDTWELAVVDLFLKHGSGLDILRACGCNHEGRVVVVLSNYATKKMREACAALGAEGVFDKSTQLDMFFDFCALKFQGRDGGTSQHH